MLVGCITSTTSMYSTVFIEIIIGMLDSAPRVLDRVFIFRLTECSITVGIITGSSFSLGFHIDIAVGMYDVVSIHIPVPIYYVFLNWFPGIVIAMPIFSCIIYAF
jgi:hypothetical protein